MLITSSVSHGNMHPSIPPGPEVAQSNFTHFCESNGYDPTEFIGLRIDPSWEDGARVVDLSEGGAYDAQYAPGSVAVADRIDTHALILPRSMGSFVLSADCFAVELETKEKHALCHVGWRSGRDNLIPKVITSLTKDIEPDDTLKVDIGPGIHFGASLIRQIHAQLAPRKYGVAIQINHEDKRDTFTNPNLFSKRHFVANSKISRKSQKPRGNHAILMPAAR